ncbi:protein FAM219A-like isoform X2 [Physella acuta]|uniref:protein FAM219A-like isoform X2 n=1 Tax=Physella acuta TaxID=109671 RepID=UPI0027DDE4AE|nr:protein FAM219A-like isoform X2 [Physella acuta]
MEHIEDSGIDSDQKSHNGYQPVQSNMKPSFKSLKKTSELQKKIERQRDMARRSVTSPVVDQQPRKSSFVSRSRLTVPITNSRVTQKDLDQAGSSTDQQPLVAIVSDESEEDEFDVPRLPKAAHKEITEQLIKDGYNLDLEPDDEDLDLIPPRPLNERCSCCNSPKTCTVQ